MSILTSYLLRTALWPFILGVTGWTSALLVNQVYVLFNFLLGEGVALESVAKLFISYLPALLSVTVPIGCLFSAQMVFAQLSGSRELMAVQAAGIDLRKFALPLVFAGLVVTLLMIFFLDMVLPWGNRSYLSTYDSINRQKISISIKPKTIVESIKPYVIYVGGRTQSRLSDIRVQKRGSKGQGAHWSMFSSKGQITSNQSERRIVLAMESGDLHSLGPRKEDRYLVGKYREARIHLPLPPPPTIFSGDNPRLKELPDLVEDAARHLAEGNPDARLYSREVHLRITLAVTCLLTVLVGLPLGGFLRRGTPLVNFAISFGVVLVYEFILVLGEDLVNQGLIPGSQAAWLPNYMLLLIGIPLYLRMGRVR